MKKVLSLLLVVMLVLTACGGNTAMKPITTSQSGTDETGKEMKEYATVFDTEVITLNYLVSSLSETRQIAYNLVDGLVDFNKYGGVEPCIADSWETSEDGLTYTFKLKEGLYWYTNTGEQYAEVTAQDFIDSAKYVLDGNNESSTSNIVFDVIKNAKPYFDKVITDFNEVGIKAIDKYTLEYTIENPTPYFLRMISYVCFLPAYGPFLEEVGDQFATSAETMLYNGAYIMEIFEPQNEKILVLNENYWDKDAMSISKISYKYNKEAAALSSELFLRGHVTETNITLDIMESWMKDDVKKNYVQPKPSTSYSTYYGLNFDPLYDDEFNPDNWRVAVNNKNFRKSLFHGLNKNAAILTVEPYNPQNVLLGTIIPRNFVNFDGVDYTELEPLKEFSSTDSFNKEKALEYKKISMEELKGKVNFPVTVVMPYNTASDDWAKRSQVVKQQLENLLGADFITVEIVAYAPSGFNTSVRGAGQYSIMEMTWGADYPDPATFTDVFIRGADIGWSYNKAFMALEYLQDFEYSLEQQAIYDEPSVDKDGVPILSKNEQYPQLKNKKATYDSMVEEAKAELLDIEKRYNMFAEAEAFLIDNAIVIPFFNSRGGYIASYCDPFSAYASQFGREAGKLKGKVILEAPMTPEEYKAAEIKYNIEKEEALKEK